MASNEDTCPLCLTPGFGRRVSDDGRRVYGCPNGKCIFFASTPADYRTSDEFVAAWEARELANEAGRVTPAA